MILTDNIMNTFKTIITGNIFKSVVLGLNNMMNFRLGFRLTSDLQVGKITLKRGIYLDNLNVGSF